MGELRLAIAAPRSFAKSSFFSIFYPLFCALEEGPKNILLVSSTASLSEWWLGRIRKEIENNSSLYDMYGPQKSDVWRQNELQLANGSVIKAIGADGQTRGLRPAVVLVDDLENDEGVWSENTRLKLEEWFWRSLTNVMNRDGQLILIGTILHPLSLLNKIIKDPPHGWVCRKYEAIENGKSIWPERWPLEDLLKRRKEIGEAAFQQEFMNNPIPSEWRTFKEEQIHFFEQEPPGCVYFTTVDPAFTVGSRGDPDYTAIITCAVDVDKNIYVVDCFRKRVLPNEVIDEILRQYEKWNPEVIGLETVAAQKVLKYGLNDECEKRGIYPYIKELSTGGMRKEYRIERLQPFFDNGKVFLRKEMTDFVAELLSFPTGNHDDMVDALASLLDIIRKGEIVETNHMKPGTFGEWFYNYKTKNKARKIGSNTWGNHKIRGKNYG